MITDRDLSELKRMVTNFYEGDKACISRVIKGITELVNENNKLKAELQRVKETHENTKRV